MTEQEQLWFDVFWILCDTEQRIRLAYGADTVTVRLADRELKTPSYWEAA